MFDRDWIQHSLFELLLHARQDPYVVKNFNSSIQRFIKRLFLALDHFLHLLFARADFGEDVAHRVGEHVHEFVEKRFVEAERAAVAHGAAQDAAQDVVAVVVAGLDAVGDGEAQGADVVGDDAEGDVDRFVRLRSRASSSSCRRCGASRSTSMMFRALRRSFQRHVGCNLRSCRRAACCRIFCRSAFPTRRRSDGRCRSRSWKFWRWQNR